VCLESRGTLFSQQQRTTTAKGPIVTNNRFDLCRLNQFFYVTDVRRTIPYVLTHAGTPADINNASERHYFQLTLEEAKELAAHLNAS
jgi:hypothetical protein